MSPEVSAYRFGVAEVTRIDDQSQSLFNAWIDKGYNGELEYLEKYSDIRLDPSMLIYGAKSIVVCALPNPRTCLLNTYT
ncbi:MAG: hypothetical protein K2H39_04975, partial [Paramuribaculum sp.]|nr:hypothetical protein [Paramuribaculum sp.]